MLRKIFAVGFVLLVMHLGIGTATAADTCALPFHNNGGLPQPPERWNGITYYPRGHHFYHMLNDWFGMDKTSGLAVWQMVDRDMATLAANGFNFLHLYIWDTWFEIGFNPVGQDPCASANNQWQALDGYLNLAERHGLYVGIHFVSKPVLDGLNSGISSADAERLGNTFVAWTKPFIETFSKRHGNIALWGVIWGFGPAAGVRGAANPWNAFYKRAYTGVRELARRHAPFPGFGLVGVNLTMPVEVLPGGNQYVWDALSAQRQAWVFLEMNLPEPDLYLFQFYHANSGNLARALVPLTHKVLASDALRIPPEKIMVVEFGNSSSLAPPPFGNNDAGSGDAFTPSVTLDGQRQWLINALCAFRSAGIKKFAYWTLYDAHDFWSQPPFAWTGPALAWNGYWGLFSADPSAPPKPAWDAIATFLTLGTLACTIPPQPIVALKISPSDMLRVGQSATLSWTATDVEILEIDQGIGRISGSFGSLPLVFQKAGEFRLTIRGINTEQWIGERSARVSITVIVQPLRPVDNTAPPPPIDPGPGKQLPSRRRR